MTAAPPDHRRFISFPGRQIINYSTFYELPFIPERDTRRPSADKDQTENSIFFQNHTVLVQHVCVYIITQLATSVNKVLKIETKF